MNWINFGDESPELNRQVLLHLSHPEDYLAAVLRRPKGLDAVFLGYNLSEPHDHFYSLAFQPFNQELHRRITHWCYIEKPE
jgi:hypothetical protein